MTMTNATKALIIAVINSALTLIVQFGVSLSAGQTSAIMVAVNAVLALIVALTYKSSSKRIPD